MRLRKKKHGTDRFDACSNWLLSPEQAEEWCKVKSLAIEIGSGKGGFITELARQNPNTRYISVEKERDCIVMAMEKAEQLNLTNLKFLAEDATVLRKLLPKHQFDIIYLNFSDPWPKKKYAKRRLTHRNMLRHYIDLLKEDGEIRFKSDNDKLFDFSLEEFKEVGFDITFLTYDLHKENVSNIMTEYEARFSAMGTPIKSLWAKATPEAIRVLKEYDQRMDVFRFHSVILALEHIPENSEMIPFYRALGKMDIPLTVITHNPDIATQSLPFAETVTESFDVSNDGDSAVISDDETVLSVAEKAGFFTIGIGDCSADEHWQFIHRDFLKDTFIK